MTSVTPNVSATPSRQRRPTPILVSVAKSAPTAMIIYGSLSEAIAYTDPDAEDARIATEAMAEPGGKTWDAVKLSLGL